MAIYWTDQANENKPQHPSKTRAEWKSDDKCFKVWKKELKEQGKPKDEQYVKFDLPEEMIIVAEWFSIGGFISSLNTWVRSNEIFSFGEPFVVRKNDGSIWLTWDWNTIWEKVKSSGWKLLRNIHFATKDSLNLSTLQMGWAWSGAWRTAVKEWTLTPGTHTVKLKEIWEGKKGKIEWSYPIFENANPLTDDDRALQKAFALELVQYGEEKAVQNMSKDDFEESSSTNDDELPF